MARLCIERFGAAVAVLVARGHPRAAVAREDEARRSDLNTGEVAHATRARARAEGVENAPESNGVPPWLCVLCLYLLDRAPSLGSSGSACSPPESLIVHTPK